MSKIDGIIKKIKEQKIGVSTKKVLLVEGIDDELAFGAFLRKWSSNWEQYWVLASAGKKQHVLEVLKEESEWLGVVDRDEWDDVKIAEKKQEIPNLLVLPRFCIENYLILPEEIWPALPESKRHRIENGLERLNQNIEIHLAQWINHAAVWAVINPLWEGLRGLGFKESLLELDTSNDFEKIDRILNEWHQYIEPNQLLHKLNIKRQEINASEPLQQLKKYIHGKHFFKSVIYPVLVSYIGNIKESEVKRQLFNLQSTPDDLIFIWEKMALRNE